MKLLPILSLLALLPSLAFTFTLYDFQINDLECNDFLCFTEEAAHWKISNAESAPIHNLNGTYLLGALLNHPQSQEEPYFQRNYINPKYHTMIIFSLTVYAPLDWITIQDESLQFAMDEDIIPSPQLRITELSQSRSNISEFRKFRISGKTPHSSPSFSFKVMGKHSSSPNTRIYFRDVQFLFYSGPVTNNSSPSDFPCNEGTYFDGVTCKACDSTCASCYGPSPNDCFQCKHKRAFNGINCSQREKEVFTSRILQEKTLLNETKPRLLTDAPIYTYTETFVNIADKIPTFQTILLVIFCISFVGTLAMGASSTLWSIISLQQLVGCFAYINVPYPPYAELFLFFLRRSVWSHLPNPFSSMLKSSLEDLINNFTGDPSSFIPPDKFARFGISRFFVENAGDVLFVNLLFLMILGIVIGLKKIGGLESNSILKLLKVILRWNFITRLFLLTIIYLSQSIFLEFAAFSFEGTYLTMNTILTIFSLLYMLGMCWFMLRTLVKRHNTHLSYKLIDKIYGTLYEGVTLNTTTSKYYYMAILIREVFLSFLVVFMGDSPLLQIIPLVFYNIGLLYYLFKCVTFKRKSLHYIIRIKEILILLAEILILFLGAKTSSVDYYMGVGWILLLVLIASFGMELGHLFFVQITGAKEIYARFVKLWKDLVNYFKGSPKATPTTPANKPVRVRPNHTNLDETNNSMVQHSINIQDQSRG